MINIGGDETDVSYRYKMPKLKAKIEGRGNGIRTIVPNMVDVAKALNVPPEYPTKFFGVELGAQSKYDSKSERASVNGAHGAPDLQKILTKFIQMFILCPRCELPEIKWNVTKTALKIDCAACGYNGQINNQHRLLTYILKTKSGKGKKKDKSSKKDRRERRAKQASGAKSKPDRKVEEDVVWHTDTTKEAVEARKKLEFEKMTNGREKVSTVSSKDSPVLVLRDYIKTKDPSVPQILAELKLLQVARGFSETEKFKILIESTIDTSDPKSVASQFEKNAKLYGRIATTPHATNLFLLCMEELVGVGDKIMLKRTPIILQKLYDADVLEEEAIIKWAESPPETSLITRDSAVAVRKAAKPFVIWLQEAEEEDDD
ncbi:hypothetical protein AAMO2058_000857700 [Amorphochlora amoebiformis]|uniref:W2 domain-containing protein n=1 Tax=Amorphochlora amoebiformis TaxID=1561963 RepID=A0A7S0H591_9EUKA